MTCGRTVTWSCAIQACSARAPSAGSTRNAGPYPTRPRRSTQHAWARAMHGFPRRLSVPSLRRAVSSACRSRKVRSGMPPSTWWSPMPSSLALARCGSRRCCASARGRPASSTTLEATGGTRSAARGRIMSAPAQEDSRMPEGRCLCGALRFEADPPFQFMVNCHCSMCRKHHGAAFATFIAVPPAKFRWISGEANVGVYASSDNAARAFCRVCGSVAPHLLPAMGQIIIPAANLQGELGVTPQLHIFAGSRAPWHESTDELPRSEGDPPGFDAPAIDRPRVTPRAGVVEGSCVCGDVAYEIRGTPLYMWNCHCSRCRLGRSAAHASNVFYPLDAFRWTRGETQVVDFQLPEAPRFGTAFCRRCGGGLPRVSAARGFVVVPAGSLDVDPGIRPSGHIFVSSKAEWHEITGELPRYDELPPPG